MTYHDAVSYLESLVDFERLGFRGHFADTVNLDSLRALLELLGNPQHGLRCVHIAGTKGKGSVAMLVEGMLRAAGLRTGLFTSPHLVSFRERIAVNGRMVSEEEIAWAVERVRGPIETLREAGQLNPSTFFEAYTAMAYLLFREREVSLAVMETGLGGRLDATNTCEPIACAITTLGLDHTEVLGETIEQITREKAGILKAGIPAVYAPQPPAAEAVLLEEAAKVGAPLRPAPRVVQIKPAPKAVRPQPADELGLQQVTLELASGPLQLGLPLAGEHQAINLAVAVGLVEVLREQGYAIPVEAIQQGALQTRPPGRLQIVGTRPWIMLDVAHNEPSAQALAEALPQLLGYQRLIAVVGLSAEKDALAFCRTLAPLVDVAILTQAHITRALPASDLERVSQGLWHQSLTVPSVTEALRIAQQQATPDDCILVTGSFYVVGEAIRALDANTDA